MIVREAESFMKMLQCPQYPPRADPSHQSRRINHVFLVLSFHSVVVRFFSFFTDYSSMCCNRDTKIQ